MRWRGLAVPAMMLTLWEISARLIDSRAFPTVSVVLAETWELTVSGTLAEHIGLSVLRVLAGFAVGALVGAGLGLATGLSTRTEAYLDPTLQFIRSIPSLAWVPLLLLWMGIGESPKVTLIAIGAFFPVYLNVVAGIRGIDRKLVEVGQIYGFSGLEMVRRIILPAALPSILTGLRTGLAVAWLYVVAAEMTAASKGLGFLLTWGREIGRPAFIFIAMIFLGIAGKVSDGLLKYTERRLLAWRDTITTEEAKADV